MDDIWVTDTLVIPAAELELRFTRSGGPGGQHVNTRATRVELSWDITGSPSLDDGPRARLLEALAGRLDRHGTLRVVADDHRSQLRNRALAAERLRDLVAAALEPRKERRSTRPSRAARRLRLERKRRLAEKKRSRRRPRDGWGA